MDILLKGKEGCVNVEFHKQALSKSHLDRDFEYVVQCYLFYDRIIDQKIIVMDKDRKSIEKIQIMPDFFQAMKPILGALLLEHENLFCEPLNGPLWYLPAILMMHIIIDLCRKTKHQHWVMISLCMISFVLYAANKYWNFAPSLTPMGLMRNLPYYYIGYLFGQYHLFKECNLKRDFISCILCLSASILLFSWHLDAFYSGQHMLHIIIFYPTNIAFLFGVLYGCKVLNGIRFSVVTNISIGTLVIVGLHFVAVTIVNYALSYFHLFDGIICYQWYEALPITLIIVAILYPIILISLRRIPILVGKMH